MKNDLHIEKYNFYKIIKRLSFVNDIIFLGPLLFLIYINDLLDGLTSMCKIFADDTSLFSKVIDKNNSNSQLNSDLAKISK